jgi:putative hemolysin
MNNWHIIIIVLGVYCLMGCTSLPTPQETPESAENDSQIANPASKYCEENGGRVDIRTAGDGSQAGFCIFPDGSECEEWAYMRGECLPGPGKIPEPTREITPVQSDPSPSPTEKPAIANPAAMYCEEHGGRLELRSQSDGSQAGYCIFPDNSECEEWAYMRGECAPADITSIFTNVVGKIINQPNDYIGQEVSVTGFFRGWDLLGETGNSPPVTRSDWVIKDGSGAMYIASEESVEIPFNPSSQENTVKILKVVGVVTLSDSGKPFLSLKSTEVIKTP